MRKFEVHDDEIAPLEIAQAFEVPNICHLNRFVEKFSSSETPFINAVTVPSLWY